MTWTIGQDVTVLAEGSPVYLDRVVALCADGAPRLARCRHPFRVSGWVMRGGCRYSVEPTTDDHRAIIAASKAWERLRQVARTPGQTPNEALMQQIESLIRVIRGGFGR